MPVRGRGYRWLAFRSRVDIVLKGQSAPSPRAGKPKIGGHFTGFSPGGTPANRLSDPKPQPGR